MASNADKAKKLILTDAKAKGAIEGILGILNGASYQFAADVLKASSHFLNVDSKFDSSRALATMEKFIADEKAKIEKQKKSAEEYAEFIGLPKKKTLTARK